MHLVLLKLEILDQCFAFISPFRRMYDVSYKSDGIYHVKKCG